MRFKQQFKIMQKLSLALFLFCISGCGHVAIRDAQVCSPIPGNLGAACDDFLVPNPVILNQAGWAALQQRWLEDNQIVECTSSNAIADIKAEIEKLCAVESRCDYESKKAILDGLIRIQSLGTVNKKAATK